MMPTQGVALGWRTGGAFSAEISGFLKRVPIHFRIIGRVTYEMV
jgi:hypothetical protein